MISRISTAMMLATALLVPMAFTAPAASGPDLQVQSFTVERSTFTVFTTTVCNKGDVPVTGAAVHWTFGSAPGPLNTANNVDQRYVGSLPVPTTAPGKCNTVSTFVRYVDLIGEYTATTTIAGDGSEEGNFQKIDWAFPAALRGSGVGGLDV